MIAVKTAYTYTYYTRNFMVLKVRKELYINFTLIKMLLKKIHRTFRTVRCILRRGV